MDLTTDVEELLISNITFFNQRRQHPLGVGSKERQELSSAIKSLSEALVALKDYSTTTTPITLEKDHDDVTTFSVNRTIKERE